MPAEKIGNLKGYTAAVGWTSGLDVQIGVIPPEDLGEGWWMDLSRADCNRLIKHLRRARDAAYGRDE